MANAPWINGKTAKREMSVRASTQTTHSQTGIGTPLRKGRGQEGVVALHVPAITPSGRPKGDVPPLLNEMLGPV